jgi:predicted tellurium resistance membrane protein TerC
VAVVLGFIGAKMIAEYFGYVVPTEVALGVVLTCLGTGVGLSVWEKQQQLNEDS